MTVGEKLHQTLAQAESVAANLKSFALDTQDQQAKAMYSRMAEAMENEIIQPLKSRVNYTESQEPQYRVYQQAQQQASQGQQKNQPTMRT